MPDLMGFTAVALPQSVVQFQGVPGNCKTVPFITSRPGRFQTRKIIICHLCSWKALGQRAHVSAPLLLPSWSRWLVYLFIRGCFVVQTKGIDLLPESISGDKGLDSLVLAKTMSSPSVSFHSSSLVLPSESDGKPPFLRPFIFSPLCNRNTQRSPPLDGSSHFHGGIW